MPSEDRRKKPGCRRIDHANRLRGLRGAWLIVALCAALAGCRTLSRQGPVPQSVATARQLTQQGITARDRGDWKRAESLLGRAVQTNPTDPDARRNYAETLWRRGALQEALRQLEEARRVAAEDPGLVVRTGELRLALGQVNYANRMADEALELDPKFAPAWALRGRVAEASGQMRQALADYQRSLGYAPDSRDVAILVAEAYRQLNEPERALVALQRLADSYSPGEEPQQVLHLEGLALMALGRYDDAVQSLSKAASRDRPSADVLCQLAEAELRLGRVASAQSTVRQALALDPSHAASRTLSARVAAAPPPGRTIMR
ncbi:MAG: tetratricopeptide repeat protein [Planctomycetia bacterium]|nr:tetratricopeptide repeat protein [Planctomycetia bacterium]